MPSSMDFNSFLCFFFSLKKEFGVFVNLFCFCVWFFFFSFAVEMEGKGGTVWKFCLFLLLFWALEEMEDFD